MAPRFSKRLVGALFRVHSLGAVHRHGVTNSRDCAQNFHQLTGHYPRLLAIVRIVSFLRQG